MGNDNVKDYPPYLDYPKPRKSITNADRIRAMTDEEIADWVWSAETSGRAYGPKGKKAWLDWLEEVTDD